MYETALNTTTCSIYTTKRGKRFTIASKMNANMVMRDAYAIRIRQTEQTHGHCFENAWKHAHDNRPIRNVRANAANSSLLLRKAYTRQEEVHEYQKERDAHLSSSYTTNTIARRFLVDYRACARFRYSSVSLFIYAKWFPIWSSRY